MANPNLRLLLHVPNPIAKVRTQKKCGRPPGCVAQFDSEIVRYEGLGYEPSKISQLLC